MDCISILAQVARTSAEAPQPSEWSIIPINTIWEYITSLRTLEALTFISFGIVCLLYGWRVFKILVIISFGLLGMFLGVTAAGKISGEQYQLLGGVVGLGLLAVLSLPLMRWAVCILGAGAGGILTSGLWLACALPEQYWWAGGLVGIVAGGMISFIVFKIAVMLFSSLGGGSLMVVGFLALLHIYPQTQAQVKDLVFTQKWFLPIMLFIPTAVGIFVQNKFVKSSKDWNI